jgi:hypothetical protein
MAAQETTYYQAGDVHITSSRAVMGGTTYPLANISSVGVGEKPVNRSMGVIAIVLALAAIACGLSGSENAGIGWVVAVILIMAGVYSFVQKPDYFVKVGSAGGEQRALVSKDRAYIEKIVAALNEAIIKRG